MVYTSTSKTMVLKCTKHWLIILFSINIWFNCAERKATVHTDFKTPERKMNNQSKSNSNSDCEVKISLSLSDPFKAQCLVRVINKTPNDIYLFNRIYTDYLGEGIFEVDKNSFYAFIDEKGILFLVKAIIPPPKGLYVEKKIVPCCTKILPKEVFEESLEIKLPIRLYSPYTAKKDIINKSYPVKFRLGYFVGHGQTQSMELKVRSTLGDLIYFDPFDFNYQKVIEVGLFDPLPVSN